MSIIGSIKYHGRTGHLLLGVLILVWIVGVAVPALSRITAASRNTEQLERMAAGRARLLADRDTILGEHERWARSRSEDLAADGDVTDFMRALTSSAPRGIQFARMNPRSTRRNRKDGTVGVEAELRGPLDALVSYLHDIEAGGGFVRVTFLNLRGQNRASDTERRRSRDRDRVVARVTIEQRGEEP